MFLLETIKINNGQLCNIECHNERFNRTRFELFNIDKPLSLEKEIRIPEKIQSRLVKCRVSYSDTIHLIEFEPYIFRPISSLKMVICDDIDYSHKYKDRRLINTLFQQKGSADDILIIKNACISDTSTSNIVFFDGKDYFTPSNPLLAGTKRALYLKTGVIQEQVIQPADLFRFKMAFLINAFFDLGDCGIKVEDIF